MAKWWFNKDDNEKTPEDPPPTPPILRPLTLPEGGEGPPEPPGPTRLCGDMR